MYGAFIGDIVGSKYEFDNIKTKDFPLFSDGCDYTDDTIMTAAVAKAILLTRAADGRSKEGFLNCLVRTMQDFGRRYPHPKGAYGSRFVQWLSSADPSPYGSYGNGSAMRVSPCGRSEIPRADICRKNLSASRMSFTKRAGEEEAATSVLAAAARF